MFHYVNAITNTKGDALIGYYVKLADTTTGDTIPMYADNSGTPIVSVSGLDDTCLVDSDGNADFYVESGEYHVDVYATDSTTLVHRFSNIPMVDPQVTIDLAALEAQVATDVANLFTNNAQNGVTSGCGVAYNGNLSFTVSAGTVYIAGTLITVSQQTLSLDAADATNDRIDVLYVDDTGTFGKITGTPGASPSQPVVDPASQCYLTFVYVPATATSLGITNETIYDEGGEWTATASGTGFTVGSTNAAYNGTHSIEVTSATSGSYVKFVRSSAESFDGDGSIILRIKSKATWAAKRTLVARIYLAGVLKSGTLVQIRDGNYGFSSSNTTDWQLIVLPKASFGVPAGTNWDELRISDSGGAIGCYLDVIKLQTNGTTIGGNTTFLTYDLADARYVQKTGATMTGDLHVPDDPYNATSWNGSTAVPTKNAIRDHFETIFPAGGPGTTSNALTMNNSGSGAASGSTFDGSAAKTISYNTIGALAIANNLSDVASASTARTNLGLAIGTNVQAYDATLGALAAFNTNGVLCQTAADTFAGRTLTGTSNEITVTNGNGVSGNPTLSLPTSLTFSGKTVTGGSITPEATPTTTAPGYLGCPQNIQDANYTTVMSDAGKHLYHTSASTHTWTIDSNANVAYPIGTILTFVNASGGGNVTIAITSDTLRWQASTGSRTLAANGVATALKVTSTIWRLTGDGIS